MRNSRRIVTLIVTLCIVLLAGCQSPWQVELRTDGDHYAWIDSDQVNFYLEGLGGQSEFIPFAYLLFHHGFALIDQVLLMENGDVLHTLDWDDVAEVTMIEVNGEIIVEGESFSPSAIEIIPSQLAQEIELSIMDIAPTTLSVLGLPALPDAQGESRSDSSAEHGVMIMLDGLQFQKLQNLINEGKLPFFESVGEIHPGLTVYPSITTCSTAAFLTSTPPKVNRVFGYGFRSTESKTLFDKVANHNRSVTAIEGYAVSFNLRNAEVILSGDRDGDGYTDDNVLGNSLATIQSDMPDMLFIHFHDIDDMGHTYGPDSPEYEAAIIRVDDYLSKIYQALPSGTFITIFADHGMQDDRFGPGGNHGQLTELAMVIPIIFLEK